MIHRLDTKNDHLLLNQTNGIFKFIKDSQTATRLGAGGVECKNILSQKICRQNRQQEYTSWQK